MDGMAALGDFVPAGEKRGRSLVLQVARKMVLWACVNTLILTAAGYFFVFRHVEQRTLAYLGGYLTERVRVESQVFVAAEANLDTFEQAYLSLYLNRRFLEHPKFDHYFQRRSDGTLRLRSKYFTGATDPSGIPQKGMSGFVIGNGRPLTDDFKRREMLSYYLVSRFGPAWTGQFANLYAPLPENAGMIYWPSVPWGLKVSNKRVQPAHPALWSPLYFDPVAHQWNVTYQRTVALNGRTLVYPGQDIMLDQLMSRLIRDHPAGAYNLVITKSGDLIAHPKKLEQLKRGLAAPNLSRIPDPVLRSIYQTILADSGNHKLSGVRIIEDPQIGAYVCYGEIAGPGWLFVTIYPRSLVLASAREAANDLLLLGIASFAIMTLIVLWVLRDRVARPIAQMKAASETVRFGNYGAVADGNVALPESEDNEIGEFAQSFRTMAVQIRDTTKHLETTVLERTHELRIANEELEKLSFRDALTGAYNRRSFDRDLVPFIADAQRTNQCFALILCDVDHFKLYNDTYGHQAGDRVLRIVAARMMRVASEGAVYRYGGEEFGLLIKANDERSCERLAANLIAAIARAAIAHDKSPHGHVTISAGLAIVTPATKTVSALMEAADVMLYKAKSSGRNQFAVHEQESALGDESEVPARGRRNSLERRARRNVA